MNIFRNLTLENLTGLNGQVLSISNRSDMFERSKDKCVICDSPLFIQRNDDGELEEFEPNKNQRVAQMLMNGNWCRECDGKAAVNASKRIAERNDR